MLNNNIIHAEAVCQKDSEDWYPIHLASKFTHSEQVVRRLVEYGGTDFIWETCKDTNKGHCSATYLAQLYNPNLSIYFYLHSLAKNYLEHAVTHEIGFIEVHMALRIRIFIQKVSIDNVADILEYIYGAKSVRMIHSVYERHYGHT